MNSAPGLAVFGAGRMGRQVAEAADTAGFRLVGLVGRGNTDPGFPLFNDLGSLPTTPEIVIDFSLPGGTALAANWCGQHGVPLVSGTTGLAEADEAALASAADQVAVLWASNFGTGVNGLMNSLSRLARWLPPGREVRILDIHHVHKQDAPSGTALSLGEQIGGDVHYQSRREGEVIGEHHVRVQLEGESLEFIHRAEDRTLFAKGALRAAQWLMGCSSGRYGVEDWLDAQGQG